MRRIIVPVKEQVKAYLTFNHAERRGIVVLVVLIMMSEAVNAFLPAFIHREEVDTAEFDAEVARFMEALSAPDTLTRNKPKTSKQNFTYPDRPRYEKKARPELPPVMIEINTADSAQLLTLRGIGPVFAGRILRYRGMLGGFFSKEQLLEVYGMDSARYEGIAGNISVDTAGIMKMNVNEAAFRDLLRHPYFDYETVRSIVNYRDHRGPVTCPDTLRKIIGYDPMFEQCRYYIEYGIRKME
jgi:DNA uptake protein ComE-like DNA-binding protein